MADQAQLIASLKLRMDEFEKQMKEAGVIAENTVKDIENKFSKANPVFAGTFLGTMAARLTASGIKQFVAMISELPEQFRELQHAADLAGMSLERAFSITRATGKFDATITSMENLARLLERAQRGEENSLVKLFSANDIDVKNIKTVEQAWYTIAKLAGDPALTTAQREALLQMAGISLDLTKEFAKGADEMKRAAEEAKKIEPEIIKMKAAAESLELALKAAWESMKSTFFSAWTAMMEFAASTSRQMADQITAKFGPENWLSQHAQGMAKFWEGLAAPIRDAAATAGSTLAKQAGFDDLEKLGQAMVAGRKATTKLPSLAADTSERLDQLDREEQRMRRNIAVMDAETQALGLGAEARARMKAEAQLLEAAERAGIETNDALRERIKLTADAYAQAAKRAETAKEVMEITKEFGSALADAFKEAVLQGKKLDEVLKSLIQRLSSKAIDKAFDALFNALGGALVRATGGGGSSFGVPSLGGLGSLFGRQSGGPVTAGQPYVVGEAGPELFVPRVSGTIAPSAAGVAVTYAPVIDARGADMAAVRRLEIVLAEQQRALPARVVSSVREARRRAVRI